MNTTDRLIHMANHIAANLTHDADPVATMAEHIRLFWDPRMKMLIKAHGSDGLTPTAAAALARVADD